MFAFGRSKQKRRGQRPGHPRGFTLLELMIVVLVVAILGTIAVSSYEYAMRKSRRSTAQGCLMEAAQYMERYYATSLTYVGAKSPALICSAEVQRFYTVRFFNNVVPTQSAFTLEAIPQGKQAKEKCGTMTVNQTGTKTPTADCW